MEIPDTVRLDESVSGSQPAIKQVAINLNFNFKDFQIPAKKVSLSSEDSLPDGSVYRFVNDRLVLEDVLFPIICSVWKHTTSVLLRKVKQCCSQFRMVWLTLNEEVGAIIPPGCLNSDQVMTCNNGKTVQLTVQNVLGTIVTVGSKCAIIPGCLIS